MKFGWKQCDECDRKYQNKEKHFEKYHQNVVNGIMTIPFEHNAEVKKLLRRSKLQVVKQRPDLLVRITPFNHGPTSVGPIPLEVGKIYRVEEMRQ